MGLGASSPPNSFRLEFASMKKPPANNPKTKRKKGDPFGKKGKPSLKDNEIEPGAWERFTTLIRSVAKRGHKPHRR